jgi:hypothetical protein
MATATLIVSVVNSVKLRTIHKNVNGKMDKLLDVTEEAAHLRGDREGNQRAINDMATIADTISKLPIAGGE